MSSLIGANAFLHPHTCYFVLLLLCICLIFPCESESMVWSSCRLGLKRCLALSFVVLFGGPAWLGGALLRFEPYRTNRGKNGRFASPSKFQAHAL